MRPALLLSLLAACSTGRADMTRDEPPALTVRVAPVTAAPAPEVRVLHGLTRAADEAAAGFAVGGRITSVLVDVGDTVSAGQPLARLDDRPLRAGVQALRGRVAELDSQAAQRERDVARLEALAGTRAVADQQLEQLRTRQAAVEAGRQAARGQLAEAEWALGQAVLRAPLDGVITAERTRAGEVAAAGQPVLLVRGQAGLEVELGLPSRLLPGVRAGDAVAVAFPLAGLPPVQGEVRSVAAAAAPGGLFPVRVALPADAGLRPGLAAEVALQAPPDPEAVSVPLAALVSPGGQDPRVSRIVDGAVEQVGVEVQGLAGGEVAVRGPLRPGDEVVVRGQLGLSDGVRVEVVR